MEKQQKNNKNNQLRRKFIYYSSIAGAGALFASQFELFSQSNKSIIMSNNIKSIGYGEEAAFKLTLKILCYRNYKICQKLRFKDLLYLVNVHKNGVK